jgi:hypothetical protein
MNTLTTPFSFFNHVRNLNISTHQDTAHGQTSYVVASLKMVGLADVASTITNRFKQFDNEKPFNPRLLGIKADFSLNKENHPEFFVRFASLIGCNDSANLLRVYFMPDY